MEHKKNKIKKRYIVTGIFLVIFTCVLIIYIVVVNSRLNKQVNDLIYTYTKTHLNYEIIHLDKTLDTRENEIKNFKDDLNDGIVEINEYNEYYSSLNFEEVNFSILDSNLSDSYEAYVNSEGFNYRYIFTFENQTYQIDFKEGNYFYENLLFLKTQNVSYVSIEHDDFKIVSSEDFDNIEYYDVTEYYKNKAIRYATDSNYFGLTYNYETLDLKITYVIEATSINETVSNLSETSTYSILLSIVPSIVSLILIIEIIISKNKDELSENKSISKTQLEHLFDSFDETVILFETKNRETLFVADNVEKIIGIPKEELDYLPILFDINGVNITEKIFDSIVNATYIGNIKTYLIENKFKQETAYIQVRIQDMLFDRKKCYALTITDVTKEHDELEDIHLQLEAANTTSKQKSDFLSKVSHEIRTPLNAVLGLSELAVDHINQNKIKDALKDLDNVKQSGDYLLSIINNVLDLSKIETGAVVLKKEEFSLKKLLEDTEQMLTDLFRRKKLKFKKDYKFKDDLILLTDRTQLQQVLINLIANAIKYSKVSGNVTCAVITDKISDSKTKVAFKISDNGLGMTKEFMDKIFEPFSRENRTDSYAIGTGLGLTITKSIVELLNGTIEVSSIVDYGTTFTTTFVFDTVLKKKEESIDILDYDFKDFRVLVVEDNNINMMICENHLKKYNFKIEKASNGIEALEKFKESKEYYYDLILMDIQMPEMDGYEATSKIRELDRLDSDVLILAMTADAFAEDINKALMNKMDGHIAKPIEVKKMIKTIYDALVKRGKI